MILTDQEHCKDCGQCFHSNIHPFVMDCYFHSASFKVMRLIAQRAMMSKLFCQSGTQFSIFVGQLDIQTVSSNRREERITLVNKTLKKVMINGCHVCVVFILLWCYDVIIVQRKAFCTWWQSKKIDSVVCFLLNMKTLRLTPYLLLILKSPLLLVSLLLLIFTMLTVLMTTTMTIHHVDVKVTIYIYFVAIGFIKK